MEMSVLNAYRQLHRLQSAPAFGSAFNERILVWSGVGRRSPTMLKHRERRPTSRDCLALLIKKDFNDAMVNESELIAKFLYSTRNQGSPDPRGIMVFVNQVMFLGKSFRMRFRP